MNLLRLLLVQRQSPPVLVAQSSSTGLRNAPGTVAEPRLRLRLLLRLRLPLLEEVLLGTTTGRLSDRLLLWNGCGGQSMIGLVWFGLVLIWFGFVR